MLSHTCTAPNSIYPNDPHPRTPIARIIRADGEIDEPSFYDSESDQLARIIWQLPMHAMTADEIAWCDRYRSEAEVYCIALAAIVYCRLTKAKMRHPSHTSGKGPVALFNKFTRSGIVLSNKACGYLIAYIHNHLHSGDAFPLPVPST